MFPTFARTFTPTFMATRLRQRVQTKNPANIDEIESNGKKEMKDGARKKRQSQNTNNISFFGLWRGLIWSGVLLLLWIIFSLLYSQFLRTQHFTETIELCNDCKEIWTPRGHIEYSVVKGHGPPVLVVHGTPGGADQSLNLVKQLFPPGRRGSDPLLTRKQKSQQQDNLQQGSNLDKEKSADKSDDDKPLPPYTFIIVSRPGYLRTPLAPEMETAKHQAQLYAQLLDDLDIDNVAVLALHGGGISALEFARQYPTRCWGVMLLGSPFPAVYDHWILQFLVKIYTLSSSFGNFLFKPLVDFAEYMVVRQLRSWPNPVDGPMLSFLLPEGSKEYFVQNSNDIPFFLRSLLTVITLSSRWEGYVNDVRQMHAFYSEVRETTAMNKPNYENMLLYATANVTAPIQMLLGDSGDSVGQATLTQINPKSRITHVPHLQEAQLVYPKAASAALESFLEANSEFLVW